MPEYKPILIFRTKTITDSPRGLECIPFYDTRTFSVYKDGSVENIDSYFEGSISERHISHGRLSTQNTKNLLQRTAEAIRDLPTSRVSPDDDLPEGVYMISIQIKYEGQEWETHHLSDQLKDFPDGAKKLYENLCELSSLTCLIEHNSTQQNLPSHKTNLLDLFMFGQLSYDDLDFD